MDLFPKRCNLCGGDVVYISNSKIYGKEYGSGKCYYCAKCSAYVGTHKSRPKEALGILANAPIIHCLRYMSSFEVFLRNLKGNFVGVIVDCGDKLEDVEVEAEPEASWS